MGDLSCANLIIRIGTLFHNIETLGHLLAVVDGNLVGGGRDVGILGGATSFLGFPI